MTIRDVLMPLLLAQFNERGLIPGEPPDPIAVFPAAHPLGRTGAHLRRDSSADLAVGDIAYDHFFNPYDAERGTADAYKALPMMWSVFWSSCLPIAC